MRIGLKDDHRVGISSRGPFRVIDSSSGETVWRAVFEDELQVVAEGGPKGDVPKIYRVQVGAFAEREAAEAELQRLEQTTGTAGVVRHDPDRGNWRVRLGRAEARLSLNPLMERLRQAGLRDLWIAEEPAEELTGVRLRLVDASFDNFLAEPVRLAVVPVSEQHIEVNGKPYRGIVELRLTPFGTVRPINWVNLEWYLLGVVPAELGPEVWPQLEALRAQAVAARTYAWRNRGQFVEQGYDICATPRCQVYQGVSAEHPLSDRAVQSTGGEVLVWEGRPIVALYTATCGGHTEDGHEVFPESREPYLTGVPCRAESEAMSSLRKVIRGRRNAPFTDETGEDGSRDWSLLRAAGVIVGKKTGPDAARQPIDGATLRDWTERLGGLAGLAPPAGPTPQPRTLGEAAAALVADLGWSERSDVLLSDEDLPALLRDPKAEGLPEDERRALAYLVWIEALRPFPDGRLQVKRLPSRVRMARVLARAGEIYRAFGLRDGVVSGVGENSIRLVRGKGEVRLPLAERPYLFGLTGGKSAPAERFELWPGDRVRFRTNGGGAIDFLELIPPVKGAADDRSAAVYSWEVRKTRRELEAAVNARVSVGRLKDLQVVRRGVSGRIVELRVVGTSGSTVVRGFDVRRLLDLRESLTVIEIQRDGEGQIAAVVFAGKGWGHGVGLCQVGAFGMALRGSTYQQILSHYYQGTRLEQLVSGPR
jgi:stage II sporulation protein D